MKDQIQSGFQGETVHLALPGMPEFVSMARLSVASAANMIGFSIEEIEDLKVVVSEACTNALRHGCGHGDTYDLYFTLYADRLEILVEDQGEGCEPERLEEAERTEFQTGGFGLYIIKALMDDVEVKSGRGSGTAIRMVKYLRP